MAHGLREFALAVPPIGGLAAAQIPVAADVRRRLRFYCAILGSKVWSPSGGEGTQRLPGQKIQEALAKVQRDSSETIIVSHLASRRPLQGDNPIALCEGPVEKCDSVDDFERSLSPSVILCSILKGHFALLRELLHLCEAGTVRS